MKQSILAVALFAFSIQPALAFGTTPVTDPGTVTPCQSCLQTLINANGTYNDPGCHAEKTNTVTIFRQEFSGPTTGNGTCTSVTGLHSELLNICKSAGYSCVTGVKILPYSSTNNGNSYCTSSIVPGTELGYVALAAGFSCGH